MARIEKECTANSGNRCDVVTLYSGGRYDLYQYKKYTDVRLVFAPEESIAHSEAIPTTSLTLATAWISRYSEPMRTASRSSRRTTCAGVRTGVKDGELTFVAGNPGTTGRMMTMAQLEYSRDVAYPVLYARLESMIKALEAYGAQSPENKRVAGENLLSAQNSYKAYTGFLSGLRDKQLMARKQDEEQTLRAAVEADPAKRKKFGKVWDQLAAPTGNSSQYSRNIP